MPLTDEQVAILGAAGNTPDSVARQRAVALVLGAAEAERPEMQELLLSGFLAQTQPSFHLIPRGDAMATEEAFSEAYAVLERFTLGFRHPAVPTIKAALEQVPATLAPLRIILGLTHSELAVAIRLVNPEARTGPQTLRRFERSGRPARTTASRRKLISGIADAASAIMDRRILRVPEAAAAHFHSKLDKRDTLDGWQSVAASARGVPYSALLYQRYVGGAWRQVQDAHSEMKGDALLEDPLSELLEEHGVPHYRTPPGATGAAVTAERYGVTPAPDFLIPEAAPTLAVEAKVGEDGGTVRDKAARIQRMAVSANDAGLRPCAVIDGKGWSERTAALLDVIIATQGRTYTLATLDKLIDLPEIAALRER